MATTKKRTTTTVPGPNRVINPDSLMLRQIDGQWQKFCALLLWKLVGRGQGVTINEVDIKGMSAAFEPGMATISVYGVSDAITLKLVSEAEAHKLAVEDAKKVGRAS